MEEQTEQTKKEYINNASALLAQIQSASTKQVQQSPSLYYYNEYKAATEPLTTAAQQSFPYNPEYQLRPIDAGYRQTTLNNDNEIEKLNGRHPIDLANIKYDDKVYVIPQGESENLRLNREHELFKFIIGGLWWGPLSEVVSRTTRAGKKGVIGDWGAGTGIWAMELAQQFPGADTHGNDIQCITPIKGRQVPRNCFYRCVDITKDLTLAYQPESFDAIQIRCLYAAIQDYPALLKDTLPLLRPGGMLLLMEPKWTTVSRSMTAGPCCRTLATWIEQLFVEKGLDPGLDGDRLETYVRASGEFDEVKSKVFHARIGAWPAYSGVDLPNRHVAHLFADDLLNLFRSFIPIFLKRGYYEPDINNIIARAAKETTLTKYRIVEELHYTYAIKRQ
ncbi:hypothetical protein E3P86_01682 [Wallemia ichthyophaga]|uniref:Methyltransferase domain-containing protein n=1 Tax=Wallemia ichthyophaga TaxID=245174 RepID=A0A4T0J756_WALIC|nr:hypothetical protein E3P86_01682 [Wallemia ichthyophaga]